jgi:twitching motility protein PilT
MVDKGASDLHVTTGSPPQLRIDGELVPLRVPPLGPVETKQLCYSILTDEQKHVRGGSGARPLLRREEPGALPRQRLHAARRRGGRVPDHPLQDPRSRSWACRPSSRSCATSRAGWCCHRPDRLGQVDDARVDDRQDQHRAHEHIVTIEDPIEFLHPHKSCVVNQREIGSDTKSFKKALQVRSCGRTPTSCWSARCATSRPSRRR